MQRRSFLKLGAVGTGLFFVGAARQVFARVQAPRIAIPTVDRLVLTSTIDGSYDAVFPGAGRSAPSQYNAQRVRNHRSSLSMGSATTSSHSSATPAVPYYLILATPTRISRVTMTH